jgi:excisionase family DNA binding protein
MSSEWLTVPQAAAELGVSRQTVRDWIRKRALHAVQGVNRGAFRIHRVEMDRFKGRIGLLPGPDARPRPASVDLTDPERFYEARIQPVLTDLGERSPEAVLRRLSTDLDLASDYYKFPSDYAHYVGRMAEAIGGGHGKSKTG